jgi:hypothetical protein
VKKRLAFLTLLLLGLVSLTLNPVPARAATVASEPAIGGEWKTVPLPENKNDWMQAVHTALLPNGKILIVNGSSNRNTLVIENGVNKFTDGVKTNNPDAINNTALFDPKTETFEHIASPPAELYDQSNDPFCSGHLHLSDGNVLFVSGSNRYYPGEKFEGSKQTNVYNWNDNTWTSIGQLKEGRWYPSLVPLADGKIVIFSGIKYGAPNQITPTVEIYNPKTQKIHYIDLTEIDNSPFNTKVYYQDKYEYPKGSGKQIVKTIDAYDQIDVYPRVFPTADGRLLITGDGAGKFPLELHASNKSYFMSINEDEQGKISVSFEEGPDRQAVSKVYGTALPDPNKEGDVLLIGGIVGTNDINFGRPYQKDANAQMEAKGVRIAKSLERWVAPEKVGEKGKWEIAENFLDKPRSMHLAVILPTKEILTINGGQYGEYKPVFDPLLMSPDANAQGGYKTQAMNPAKLPRLYHNGALLLPDARVLSIGGNPSRAGREKDGTVHVDVLPNPAQYYEVVALKDESGKDEEFKLEKYYQSPTAYKVAGDPEPFIPAEIWQAEIFSPPYLFQPGARPEIADAPTTLKYGQPGTIAVNNATENSSLVLMKLGTVTHGFDYGQRLADLKFEQKPASEGKSEISFNAPANANLYPPGYYMMFYVNNVGKPSIAKMVKLEA